METIDVYAIEMWCKYRQLTGEIILNVDDLKETIIKELAIGIKCFSCNTPMDFSSCLLADEKFLCNCCFRELNY